MNGPRRRAWQALQRARAALKRGDRHAARAWARRAVRLAPTWDVPWTLLGLLTAQPAARAAYLRQALRLNPSNRRAAQALARLRGRQVGRATRVVVAPRRARTRPRARRRLRVSWAAVGLLWGAVVVLVLLSGWVGWHIAQAAAEPPPLLGTTARPTASATPWQPAPDTPTPTPSPSPTPSPTPTVTPTPTATPYPSPTPTATPSPAPTATPIAWARPAEVGDRERWILVDLSEQRLYALEGDQVVRVFVVSTGLPSTPTVVGTFRIWIKLPRTDMAGPGYYLPDVPYTMYFFRDYGIHGAYWHNNFGQPMSHGCVNMRIDDAEWLFRWAAVGSVVRVVP